MGKIRGDGVKTVEGIEEVIAGADGRGHEVSHGKCVDQRVVEILIAIRLLGGNISAVASGRAGRGRLHSLYERKLGWIDTEAVLNGGTNQGLGVDGAGQVIMEIGALGHAVEELAKRGRVLPDAFEQTRGASFVTCGLSWRWRQLSEHGAAAKNEQK